MSKKLFQFDAQIRKEKKIKIICGIDETGRGCWAGPLVAASVIFHPEDFIDGLDDSKKLSNKQRLNLDEKIKSTCLSWAISEIQVDEIDKKGINFANSQAMKNSAILAAQKINLKLEEIDFFIIDQSPCKSLNPYMMIPKADSKSASVAAASILAKNHRDAIIKEMSDVYPNYEFSRHNGYINNVHVDAVNSFGLIDGIHRKSFIVSGYNKPKQLSLMEILNENTNF